MTALLCPLCSQPHFNNLESLRFSLIKVATQDISCPICSETLAGLDKLTIHLFGHTITQNYNESPWMEPEFEGRERPPPPPPPPTTTTMTTASLNGSAKCENFPENFKNQDLSISVDFRDIKLLEDEEKAKNSDSCTVNMEDLSFLTSWEKDLEAKSTCTKAVNANVDGTQETSDLSEYMSDLLNKNLPIINLESGIDTKKEGRVDVEDSEFKCPTCQVLFQNSILLSIHEKLVHATNSSGGGTHDANMNLPNQPEDKPEKELLKALSLPSYDCHLCHKSFKMKGSLLVHYRVAHLGLVSPDSLTPDVGGPDTTGESNFYCSICNKSFKKEQHLTQHIKTHEGKQWHCETCNKYFTTKYFLKKHQRLHTGEMPYSCQICNKTFTFQQSYHKHLLYHSDDKPHQCLQCGRAFKELSTLHNHKRIHSGEKPFTCETCGKSFRQRVSYIVHQRIHTGVLPYQCTACLKKFRYKVSQRSHKCTAQPPGTVVKQTEEPAVQEILEPKNHTLS